ncbi:MAG: hypothetical protein JXB32_24840 [Deltaproteobacteria bacterium]|nr:hypothetical protein [Deltaproteobacteria bacterium]
MKKPKLPKLPKKWKKAGREIWTGGPLLKLGVFDYGSIGESVCMFVGDPSRDLQVAIRSAFKTAPRLRPRNRMIRAVELAAIHAGLVEDRDAD